MCLFQIFDLMIVSTSSFAAPLTTAFEQPDKALIISFLTPSKALGATFISLNISSFLLATFSEV